MIHSYSSHGVKCLFLIAMVVCAPILSGATYPSGFSEVQVVSGLNSPIAMAFAPDGRLFVSEQGGSLRVIKNGALLATPFLSVSVDSSGERGLLGVAFDPDFSNNNFVYIYYTVPTSPIHNRVSRFTANGDVAAAGEEVLLDLDNLASSTSHNGGAIHFGLDGKLYIAVGDNRNAANSQLFDNRTGKMLRINSDGTIPADNPPFAAAPNPPTGLNRAIWAAGLRNPYTFNVHPGNGRIHINDVGEVTWEEVNEGVAEANYGWPDHEGSDGGDPDFDDPLIAYHHTSGTPTGCAITGGAFYTGTGYPSQYADVYFYADYCSQWLYYSTAPSYSTQTAFGTGLSGRPIDLQVWDGELYYLTRNTASIYRITYTASEPPAITQHPADQTVALNQPATFTVAATGTPPLHYQWQQNGAVVGDDAPSYTTLPVNAGNDGDPVLCLVSNAFGDDTSNVAVLTVQGNTPPTLSIDTPVEGTSYTFAQMINYSGSASDAEDGALPASAFTWEVKFHHDAHEHPFMAATTGSSAGSFQASFEETAANVFYRIHLTVVDSQGASATTFRDVTPQTVTIHLRTSPGGLLLKLDGIPVTANYTFTGVVGQPRSIEGISPQTRGRRTYRWRSWSDGGAASHEIITPPVETAYRAKFRR